VLLAAYIEPPAVVEAQMDDLLASPVLRDPEFARAVHGWVRYWEGPAVEWFPGFLERMAWLGGTVDAALAETDLPPSMRYLPLIESGYAPGVTSRASAVGLWQLMPATARELGLEVTPLLDERRHPERSTDAALRFLEALHGEFGSWFVTLAAYNSGPARIRRLLRQHAPGEAPTDSLLWALREHLPRETREFVPKLYGAMWVASRPEAYGFELPPPDSFVFDVVSVPDQTTLDVVGLAAGVSYGEIVRLNPEFPRWITPPDRRVTLRVPKGSGRTFRRIYPRIRPQDRVTFMEHEVRFGETLSEIATRYGLRVSEIEAANPRVRVQSLAIGARLIIPVAPSVEIEPAP
jgi:membrane-bound lytic murein transglycosylase D